METKQENHKSDDNKEKICFMKFPKETCIVKRFFDFPCPNSGLIEVTSDEGHINLTEGQKENSLLGNDQKRIKLLSRKMGNKSNKSYKCDYCEKEFTAAKYRWNHVLRIHHKKSGGKEIEKPKYICELCGKHFSYNASLTRHISEVHNPEKRFSCDICNFTSANKFYLKRHVNRVHRVKIARVKSINCAYCTCVFSSKHSLRKHEREKHQMQRLSTKKINRKCPLCKFSSSAFKKKEIKEHFEREHNLNMEYQTFHFQNKDEFDNWKNKLEDEENIFFVNRKSNYNTCFNYYSCYRSGKYVSSGSNKRNLKIGGSCKINAFCPSEIVAKTKENGQIDVYYLPTHVGHECELKYLKLKPEERRSLAAKLLAKVPHSEILKEVRRTVSNNETKLKRIHLLNKKDLFNIEASFNIKKEAEKTPYDPVSIETCVHELTVSEDTSLLIYKPQGKYDPQFPSLQPDDFVLIFMTEAQKEMLQQYGKDIIFTDSTHSVNRYSFRLYTLLITDKTREGFPCSFMFTNRADITVMSLFYQSIRDKVGQIIPSVFMSDIEDKFFSAWTQVMGTPNLHLFSTWHVLKAWRSNLNKIKNKKKKEEVYKTLKTIMHELDPHTFHNLLDEEVKNLDEDTETSDYSMYFKEQYVKGDVFKSWAYCYRTDAKINTNMSTKNFNRALKYCYLKGKKIQRLDKTLSALLDLIRNKIFDDVIESEKGKSVSKLQILRQRHETAMTTFTDKDVLPGGDKKWRVMSSTTQDLYTVKKVKDCNNCQLQCLHCGSCFHEYTCTCLDNAVKSNMCEHIHAVAHTLTFTNTMHLSDNDIDLINPQKYEVIDVPIDQVILAQTSQDSCDEIDKKKEKIAGVMQMILDEAVTEEQINFLDDKIMSIHQVITEFPTAPTEFTFEQPFEVRVEIQECHVDNIVFLQ